MSEENKKADGVDWTKKATVAIAALALFATAASAVAAWQSWRTAKSAESAAQTSADIAKQAFEVSGARPRVGDGIGMNGDCAQAGGFLMTATVTNLGHLTGSVKRLELTIDYRSSLTGRNSSGSSGTWSPISIAFVRDLNVAVPPQDSVHIPVPVACSNLSGFTQAGSEVENLETLARGDAVLLPTSTGDQRQVTGQMYLNVTFGTGDGSSTQIVSVSTTP